MALGEVAAEKVRAVISRDKARDVYDLDFLIKRKSVAFDEALANQKLAYYDIGFSKKTFFEKIDRCEKNWKKDLGPLVFGELPGFREVRKTLDGWI